MNFGDLNSCFLGFDGVLCSFNYGARVTHSRGLRFGV